MKVETKLNYKDGYFKIYVKKTVFIFSYWKLIYKTSSKGNALTTLKNLSIISELD